MRVYVLNQRNEPLMPTTPARARKLLKENKAEVIKRTPFTIRLLIATGETKQEIVLGVDAGSKIIGVSASTMNQELYAGEVQLRNDIVDLLSTRRQNRRTRRSGLRYRKPRFLNRVKSKNKGWFAPSIQHKISSHLKVIENLHKILPITKIIVETASFDIQKIKNPEISGVDYQHGEQLDFWNVREYVLFRDGHKCQNCKGKLKDKILNVHHIESRKTGGNAPNNLITLCETCHDNFHKGKFELKLKRGTSFKDAAFMGIMRWAFYSKLKELYPNVNMTYGYITKNVRIVNHLSKTHYMDAYCIAGNLKAIHSNIYYYQKKVRCHNRQIHKANILKSGKKKLNQAPYIVKDFRLFDKVKYNGIECFITARRQTGYFVLKTLDGAAIHKSAQVKELTLLEKRKSYLTERRQAIHPMTEVTGILA